MEAIVAGQNHLGAYRIVGQHLEVTYQGAMTRVAASTLRPEVAARLALQKLVGVLGRSGA